jgi:hypothetical protein
MTAWLSQQEVDDLCEPLTQPAAQIRYLRDSLKLTVRAKPNGKALVLRSHVEDVLGGLPSKKTRQKAAEQPRQPNAAGLVLAFRKG